MTNSVGDFVASGWRRFVCGIGLARVAYAALFIASIVSAIRSGIYHGELDVYLPHYLSGKSILKIVFDPLCELDLTRTTFRGREVGSLFNYIDTQALYLLFKMEVPAFVSVVNYICVALISYFVFKIFNNEGGVRGVKELCILLYLSSPPVFYSGNFYRTNKVLTSLALFGVIALVYKINFARQERRYISSVYYTALFLAGIVACLSDEQGLVLSCVISANLLVFAVLFGVGCKSEFIVLSSSILAAIGYRKVLGGYLFSAISGIDAITPEYSIHGFHNLTNLWASSVLFVKYLSYLLGNFGAGSGRILGIVAIVFSIGWLLRKTDRRGVSKLLCAFFASSIPIVIIIHAMTTKHPAILWDDVVCYYSLPILTVVFGLLVISIQYVTARGGLWTRYVCFGLVVCICGNVASLPKYRRVIYNGHLKNFHVADKVIEAVYGERSASVTVLHSIALQGAVPGSAGVDLGMSGVEALRSSLEIHND